MDSQNLLQPLADVATQNEEKSEDGEDTHKGVTHVSASPPAAHSQLLKGLTPFWHDRLIEAGLILSITLYYVIGNENLGSGRLFHLNPLISLPFLLVFALLCWYRLPFAIALLPLSLPFYLQQKTVISHYSFSIAEIAFLTCLVVALIQFLLQRDKWPYSLSWYGLRDRLGPFVIPVMVFMVVAGISVLIAYSHREALRAFREEVFEPILYLVLAMFCLRTRQDAVRLLLALLGAGLLVALLGMGQYFLFRGQLVLEPGGIRRVHAMYGSANSIGLLFDYVLPIGLALILVKTRKAFAVFGTWGIRISAIVICLPLLLVLYLSQSRGAWVAIVIAGLFVLALSIRNRKILIMSGLAGFVVLGVTVLVLRGPIVSFIVGGHTSAEGISTVTKRLYLWQSALKMIQDHPWTGVGMENWLCYYSPNAVCFNPTLVNHYYWILRDPVTGALTGLSEEPTLSHPHNIFLQVWVSIGIFGLLAFIGALVLFYWLFVRILIFLRSRKIQGDPYLWWMTVSVGAAMLAALIHGQVDSSFLEQDLSFCFWMLVTALLLLRVLTGTPWRGRLRAEHGI